MADREFADDVIEELLDQLTQGKSLTEICQDPRMPTRRTVQRWQRDDDELAGRILEAREVGFHHLAEQAVREAVEAADPIKGRLAFDARRWYLGKLSNAFAEKPISIGAVLNVDRDDAFAAVTGALEKAAAAISSRRDSTITVDAVSSSGPADAPGRLADLAGSGGERLGEDQDGG